MLTPDDCFWKDELKEPPQTRESMDTDNVSCVVQVFRETAARGLVRAEEGIPDKSTLTQARAGNNPGDGHKLASSFLLPLFSRRIEVG